MRCPGATLLAQSSVDSRQKVGGKTGDHPGGWPQAQSPHGDEGAERGQNRTHGRPLTCVVSVQQGVKARRPKPSRDNNCPGMGRRHQPRRAWLLSRKRQLLPMSIRGFHLQWR